MQENTQIPQKSKTPVLILVLVLIVLGAVLYWYLNLPKTATFTNPAIAAFNISHNFETDVIKEYGKGKVVLAPYFQNNAEGTQTNLSIAVWSKQPGRVVQLRSISLDGTTLQQPSNVLIAPTQVQPGTHLFYQNQLIAENISIESLVGAADKQRGKVDLTIVADIIENTPQRVVTTETIKFPFDANTHRVLPWSK